MNCFLVKKIRFRKVPKYYDSQAKNLSDKQNKWRIIFLIGFFIVFSALILFRLVRLQVIDSSYYYALAFDQHEIFQQLYPKRGNIYIQDQGLDQNNVLYPIATNRELNLIYAEPRNIKDPEAVTNALLEVIDFEEEISTYEKEIELPVDMNLTAEQLEQEKQRLEKLEQKQARELFAAKLLERLSKQDDPYEPIKHRVADAKVEELDKYNLEGVAWLKEPARYYPEGATGSHLLGFVGHCSENNLLKGYYGIEGNFDQQLAGEAGFWRSELDIAGRWIAVAGKEFKQARDGSDLVLTIDKSIQFFSCEQLFFGVKNFGADSGSIIVMEPDTGKILAMCSYPDFDPNNYNKVEDISVFNNPVLLDAYEPGSVFKAITMAAAIDGGAVTPFTTYNDTGEVIFYDDIIKNSDELAHGVQTMTEVLEKSLNTGTIFAARQLGWEKFRQYVKNFGFGQIIDMELSPQAAGNLSSLDIISKNDIALGTASFGQGITVTPIQLIQAFAAIANEGKLVRPYIVEKIIKPDRSEEVFEPLITGQVISPKTAKQVGSMLVSVVENGHAQKAQVANYLVAGKTGTAQVADLQKGGYSDQTIHTFAGFAPYGNPQFVILIKLDNVKNVSFSSDSATVIFSKVAKFILDYYQVPPDKM